MRRASNSVQEQHLEMRSTVNFQTVRINPLSIASAALFFISPLLSWITVSAFGLTAQATLIEIARSKVPLDIPQNLPLVSTITTILLTAGGVVILRATKVGLPIAISGIAVYLYASYTLYRTPASVIPITIAPGLGLIVALVSTAICTASLRIKSQQIRDYVLKVKTRQGITAVGVFIGTTALAIDGLNHAGQGELSSFIGTGAIESVFHGGLLISISLVTILFLFRKNWATATVNSVAIVAAFTFLILDVAYHISTGEVSVFLGHDSTEIMLHILAYYGTAFLLVGRLIRQ